MSNVGLIGVGLLGTALAERLLAGGFAVVGYDRDAARCQALGELGGTVAESCSNVFARCDRILWSLPTSAIARQVLDDVRSTVREGHIVIDTTTGEPDAMAAIGADLARLGASYLDATVAGSSEQVRRGQGVLMIGGEASSVAGAAQVLEAIAPQRFHVGPVGSGARMKLVVNLVLGLNRAVLAEGLSLADRCGLDLPTVLEVLRAGPAYSTVMDTKGPKMLAGDFHPQARLAQHHKDVQLILSLGESAGAWLPLSTLHEQLLQQAISLGHGADDNSAIIRIWNRVPQV